MKTKKIKIIFNDVEDMTDAINSYIAIEESIKDNIKAGKINGRHYVFANQKTIIVCRSKKTYSTYIIKGVI